MSRRRIQFTRPLGLFGVSVLGCLTLCGLAYAVTTRQFLLDSAAVFSDGKLEGAAVLSSGAVIPSVGVARVELPNAGVARSLLVRADGSSIVGTGNQGKLFRVTGDSATLWAETGELLVSALVADASGTVYAGTIPHGKIFAVDRQGKSRRLVQPEGAEHIWALAYDPRRHLLFAATGPQGKVFAIDTKTDKPKADVYYASQARHVMALALDRNGALYAGTSDDALLLRIDGPLRADVVYDFEGNEITALSLREGRIAVAANHFPKPPATPEKKKEAKDGEPPAGDQGEARKDAPKPGTGELWIVEANREARKLFASSEDGHITAVQWANEGGAVYAATSKAGHIYRVNPDGTNALWIDVEERQVLAMHLSSAYPMFTTGDAGAVYRVLPGKASEALWTSKVQDAEFPARFGQLHWRAQGKLGFQTRSGNTEKPGEGWSEWSSVLTMPGPIRSPAARFLQIRVRLDPRADTLLYAVQAYYLPANQFASSKDITVKPAPAKGNEESATSTYKIEWKVDNPDGDRLRYRLHYRPENRATWRPILRESEILTRTQHEWNTEGVPDGYYRLRVEVSDELDNPLHATRVQHAESEPFLLDNHAPRIDGLRFANGALGGEARDAIGPISRLEYAVDGHDWHPLRPIDDLLDTPEETFALQLRELAKGSHVIAVRARDARNNVGSSELWIAVP